jgi:hypothetical protein
MDSQKRDWYRFPWSLVDTPGAWIEVTDSCDLACPGCFRQRIEGHRPLDVIKDEIILSQKATNCERIAIAGGEPLLYPHLLEVVEFITKQGMKAVLMTNGESLTWERAVELKKAGLVQFYFHVDSGQQRPGWEGKNEIEMNELRQRFADLTSELKGVQCGYNITVTRQNLGLIPNVVDWGLANIDQVQSLSLIAFRGLLVSGGAAYQAGGASVDVSSLRCITETSGAVDITSDEMLDLVRRSRPDFQPCAFLNGTEDPATNKFIVVVAIGRRDDVFGVFGPRAIELVQVLQHFFTGRYTSLVRTPRLSRSVFALGLWDRGIRSAFRRFLKRSIRLPLGLVRGVHLQCINLVQPTEFIGEKKNFCDGCINLIPWKGKMVHSCCLDEYRIFGGELRPET